MLASRFPIREKNFHMSERRRHARVGVDAGGTFVDVVAFEPARGIARAGKIPSDRGLDRALTLARGLLTEEPAAVVAGTTRVTNAALEGRLARTALVTTAGFADVLAIGRQTRDDLYDLHRPARVPPLVPRELVLEADERVGPAGEELGPLSAEEIDRIAEAVARAGVEAVAVCLLHSYANPEHESRLVAVLREVAPASASHEVARERREFERASTTALNAAALPEIGRYLSAHEGAVRSIFPGAASYVVHSSGGMMTPASARVLPLATVMSGPAAGVAATAGLARRLGIGRAVSLDMGGTSTDVCLLRDGLPATARDRTLGGHVVRLPAVAVESVGAGGGSIAWVDDVGALRLGPRSAGADPGPAAYGRGGSDPTVTDADVVLGTAGAWEGGISLNRDLAQEACARLGTSLGLSAEEAARAVVRVAHAELERALRLVTVRRGHDLRDCVLVAYGGAGPMHAGAVALAAGVPTVVVPPLSSTFSALGCCLSELAVEEVRTCLADLTDGEWPRVEAALEALVRNLADGLAGNGSPDLHAVRSLELRYRGQNEELDVPLPPDASAPALRAAFRERHEGEFGYATDEPVEVTAVRARLWVDEGTPWAVGEAGTGQAEVGETELRLAERPLPAGVLHRGALEPGRRISGPAVLVDELSTVVVWPGLEARVDESGSVLLEASG
jgi:N-methylhydantoinase A